VWCVSPRPDFPKVWGLTLTPRPESSHLLTRLRGLGASGSEAMRFSQTQTLENHIWRWPCGYSYARSVSRFQLIKPIEYSLATGLATATRRDDDVLCFPVTSYLKARTNRGNWTELTWFSFWRTGQWASSNALQQAPCNGVGDCVTKHSYTSNGLAVLAHWSVRQKLIHVSSVQLRRSVRALTQSTILYR